MFKRFTQLQWKAFARSASFGKSLGIKIFMGFLAVYFLVVLAGMGTSLYFILRKAVPDQSPLWTLSHYLIYWLLAELVFRYFMQKLPVMDIKPFLINNISKSKITHYILGKSGFSAFNLIAFAGFLPFAIVLLVKDYQPLNVVCWFLAVLLLALTINYLNFLINKNNAIFGTVLAIFGGLYALDHFAIVDVKALTAPVFHALYAYPLGILVVLALLVLIYLLNYLNLKKVLYLDGMLQGKSSEAKTSELSWTKRFGEMAPFLQLDLKLIWRNKRTKMQVFISVLFALYGLIFYTQEIYANMVVMHVFLGIFMTGIFLSNFGQFIPAWDSAYYGMMMSQNIPLRKYLESKALLITVSIVVMFVLTIPYAYFGWKIFLVNLACAFYNLGINVPVILYFGSFNKKRIELDKSPVGNMQGTSAVQFLIMLPVLLAPILLFALFHYLISFDVAIGVFIGLGVAGYLLKNQAMNWITQQYAQKKYGMLQGFKEKNA